MDRKGICEAGRGEVSDGAARCFAALILCCAQDDRAGPFLSRLRAVAEALSEGEGSGSMGTEILRFAQDDKTAG
jgi:hypothetical protein